MLPSSARAGFPGLARSRYRARSARRPRRSRHLARGRGRPVREGPHRRTKPRRRPCGGPTRAGEGRVSPTLPIDPCPGSPAQGAREGSARPRPVSSRRVPTARSCRPDTASRCLRASGRPGSSRVAAAPSLRSEPERSRECRARVGSAPPSRREGVPGRPAVAIAAMPATTATTVSATGRPNASPESPMVGDTPSVTARIAQPTIARPRPGVSPGSASASANATGTLTSSPA